MEFSENGASGDEVAEAEDAVAGYEDVAGAGEPAGAADAGHDLEDADGDRGYVADDAGGDVEGAGGAEGSRYGGGGSDDSGYEFHDGLAVAAERDDGGAVAVVAPGAAAEAAVEASGTTEASSPENLVQTGQRSIGRGGLRGGPLAFGCWRFFHEDVQHARELIEHAVDLGMNLIDTADVYGVDFGGPGFGAAEELLGKVLASSGDLRDRIVLATKGGICPGLPFNSSASYLRRACEASLRRLQVDTIDLYQVHHYDFFTHPEEVAKCLLALRAEGKVREVGISNYSFAEYDALVGFLGPRALATVQPEFSAAETGAMDDGVLDRCLRDAVTPLAYSPLAGGRLATGEGVPPELVSVLDELADREGVTRSAVAVAFVLTHPSRPIAIVGSQRADRLDEIALGLGIHLDQGDCYRILEASLGTAFD